MAVPRVPGSRNLAGLGGVLVYTGLLRGMPLHVAFPLSRGAGVLGVQLVGSVMVFGERFSLREAVGATVVAAGIILVGLGAPDGSALGKVPRGRDSGT